MNIILHNNSPVKCKMCKHRLECLTDDKAKVKCKKTGKWVDLKTGGLKLWGE